MKYIAEIRQGGWGCFTKPEHFLGEKTLYNEVFDDLNDAKKALYERVKDLYDKYELCREWEVVDIYEAYLKTKIGENEGWCTQYWATIEKWTDEEFEELKAEGLV